MSCNFQQKKALRISESEGGADGPGPRGRGGWTESRAGGAGNPTNKHSSRRSLAAATGPDAATHDGQTPARTGAGPGVLPQSSGEKRGRDEGLWPPTDLRSASLYKELGPRKSQLRLGVNLGIRVVRGMLEGNYLQTHREMSITFLHFLLN